MLVASSYPNELEIHKTALEQKLGYADSKYIVYMGIESTWSRKWNHSQDKDLWFSLVMIIQENTRLMNKCCIFWHVTNA